MAVQPENRASLPRPPEIFTQWHEKTPPMAEPLINGLNELAEKYNLEPLKFPGSWSTIEESVKPYLFPTSLMLMVRDGNRGVGGDATSLVPRLIGKIDDPEKIRETINNICISRYQKTPTYLRPLITDLLSERYTAALSRSFSEAVSGLDSMIHDIHQELNNFGGTGMTDEAEKFRQRNRVALLLSCRDNYSYRDIAMLLFSPDRKSDPLIVPHFDLIPSVGSDNKVKTFKQRYLLPVLDEENLQILDRLTPKQFRSEEPDPKDPRSPDFLSRRLLRGGHPVFLILQNYLHTLEQLQKQDNYSTTKLKGPHSRYII